MGNPKFSNLRSLEEICDKENFSISLLGNSYCKLAMDKKIECKRQAKTKDQNGFYPCLDLRNQSEKYSYKI